MSRPVREIKLEKEPDLIDVRTLNNLEPEQIEAFIVRKETQYTKLLDDLQQVIIRLHASEIVLAGKNKTYPKRGHGLIDYCPKCGGLITFWDAELDGPYPITIYACEKCEVHLRHIYQPFAPARWEIIKGYGA